jgi:DnaD/phage-associated family protein
MAEKRMFAQQIIDSDAFLDMPLSTQALYFHLCMRADDDGFINNPKRIQRMVGCSDDDLKLLLAKSFIIAFENGVVVIKHWRIHNTIQKDRYKPTAYKEEMAMLRVKENRAYTLETIEMPPVSVVYTECIQDVSKADTQVRLDKIRLDKIRIDNNNVSENELSTGYDEQLSTVLGKIIKEKWKRTPTENEISLAIQLVGELNGQVSMLADALDIAAQYGARAKNWKYVRSIVDSWVAKGYKTEEDVLMHELNRKGGV